MSAEPVRTIAVIADGEELEVALRALAGPDHRLLRVPLAGELAPALEGCELLVADARLLGRRGIGHAIAEACPDAPLLLLTDKPREEAELFALRYRTVRYLARPHDPGALRGLAGQLLRDELQAAPRPATLGALQQERDARERAEYARAEAEEQARSQDEFLATFSHELRTPLTSILGWARMLRLGRASPDPTAPALQSIERNARLMSGLIEDLLDLQRAASGRLTMRFREHDLTAIVDAAVAAARPDAEQKGLQLLWRAPDDELRVFGDPDRLAQVVQNILANALKFTPEGGRVQVDLSALPGEALLTVQDTGHGIAPEFLSHVFEPFRQEDSGLARDKGGLGLGLALVRGLVEAHGGAVLAESAGKEAGATFTVSLPLRARVRRSGPVATFTAAQQGLMGLSGATILLVEDDEDARFLVAAMLEQSGARVVHARSAAEGLRALADKDFDLVLSDVSMPGEDGYSFIRRMRAGGRNAGALAVALTANARLEDRDRALSAGFQMHLAKPVEPEELVARLSELLGR